MAIDMGFYGQPEWDGPAGAFPATCFKRRNRWKFVVPDVSADGIGSLPPFKSGRPSISFKEIQTEHLNETIFFPGKPEWKPLSITLYDIQKTHENPIFSWIKRIYNPAPTACSYWKPCLSGDSVKCSQAKLILYDGCGDVIETWVFEHAWPQSAEFFEGDMSSSELVYCDVTLRYDRAYIEQTEATLDFPTVLDPYVCSAVPISTTGQLAFAMVPEIQLEPQFKVRL